MSEETKPPAGSFEEWWVNKYLAVGPYNPEKATAKAAYLAGQASVVASSDVGEIKLPERKDTATMQNDKSRQMREAFNSCLDEIQRLNPTHKFTSDSRGE